jgi:hypothetical protein
LPKAAAGCFRAATFEELFRTLSQGECLIRTAQQCLAKATELQSRADASPSAALKLDYGKIAMIWRELAQQAAWQDAWQGQPLDKSLSLQEVAKGLYQGTVSEADAQRLLDLKFIYNLLGALRITTAGRVTIADHNPAGPATRH